jgi:hypothetical protein
MRRLAVLASLGLAACTYDPCDPGDIQQALDDASPGDTVRIGACTVQGPFRIPPGVRLEGVGAAESAIEVLPGAYPAVDARTEAGRRTTLAGVRVESAARMGVRFSGAGDGTVEDAVVEVDRGAGVVALDLASFRLARSSIRGPIEVGIKDDPAFVEVTPEETATLGLVLSNTVGSVDTLEVSGLALFAVVAVDSEVQWTGGSVSGNLGSGLYASGSTVALTDVAVTESWQGLRGQPPFGVVVTSSTFVCTRCEIADHDRYGVLAVGSRVDLVDVRVLRNGDAGLWASAMERVHISGSASLFDENAFAGAVLVDSHDVDIRDAAFRNTREQRRNVASGSLEGELVVGDGIELLGAYDGVRFEDVAIDGNARIGLLVELDAPGSTAPVFVNTTVGASGVALGAIAGTRTMPLELDVGATGWDAGIVRSGAAATNDPLATGPRDMAALPAPSELPTVEVSALSD